MIAKSCCFVVLSLVLTPGVPAAEEPAAVDLRRGAPRQAHLAICGRHNPERDDKMAYLQDVWQTVAEERLVERLLEIVTRRVSDTQLAQARTAYEQLQTALEPANFRAVLQADQIVYAQVLELPVNHHLLLARMSPEDAAGFERAATQVCDLLQQWSGGKVSKVTRQEGENYIVRLDLPPHVPMQPALLRVGNLVILSTSAQLARQSVAMLDGDGPDSKFDDPRFVAALAQLPEPEDTVVLFDGRMLFERLRGFSDFLRQHNPESDGKIERIGHLVESIVDEVAILDYEVTVETTEGPQNRVVVLGKLSADAKDKLLTQAVAGGEPFENWQTWVPADAEAYSLSTGVNLHLIYEWITGLVRDQFPESHAVLEQLEQKQQAIGFHLDRDLLQAFPGASVSVTVPIEGTDGATTQRTVAALRCSAPERIVELLHRGVDRLAQLPPVQAQQLELIASEDLEGFYELRSALLTSFGVRPIFGFHEGWMIFSGSPEATAKILATRRGEADSIDQAASFQRFNLETRGAVHAVGYTDLGATTRQAAKTIEQIGAIAPMIVGMAAAQADTADLQPLQEMLALLPSIAKVVRKFDYLEDRLTVTRAGSQEGTYRRDAVTILRDPSGE